MSTIAQFRGATPARHEPSQGAIARALLCCLALLVLGPLPQARAADGPRQVVSQDTQRTLGEEDGNSAPAVTEAFINASLADVWRLFTTAEGLRAAGAAEATVDLRLGGEIRSRHDPADGRGEPQTIVKEILAYEPERMLAMRARQPSASAPDRAAAAGAWTVIYFDSAGEGMTRVRVVGLGYRSQSESQAFAQQARQTLDRIARDYWPKCALCESEAQQ